MLRQRREPLLFLSAAGKPSIVFFHCFAIALGRSAFIAQTQVRAACLVLCLPAQLQFKLAQRVNHFRLEIGSSLGSASRTRLGHSLQFVDRLIEQSQRSAGPSHFAPQILGVAQPLAQFRIQLTIIPTTIAAVSVIGATLTAISGT